jgi:predicted small lipoprotein YifL
MRLLVVLLLASALLQGCGLKGPLYIPTAAEEREMADRKKRLQEREAREKQQPQQTSTSGDSQETK